MQGALEHMYEGGTNMDAAKENNAKQRERERERETFVLKQTRFSVNTDLQ
jgi:hypothetical protein